MLVQQEGRPHSFLPGEPFPFEKGYLLIPFSPAPDDPAYMLVPDLELREDRPECLPKGEGNGELLEAEGMEGGDDRGTYIEKVKDVLKRIRSDEELEKVVLSRSEWIGRQGEPGAIFDRLEELYPDAYVHLFHLPDQGTWIGASPELLLDIRGDEGRTQALAGTRARGGEEEWSEKERREQSTVAAHIRSVLQAKDVPIDREKGPITTPAGSIEHLSTEFFFSSAAIDGKLSPLLKDLHPTPAVCGAPREKAMNCIRELESRSRSFYAGAIGPWGVQGERALYVNLRSARIWQKGVELFVGGGINEGSDPEKEWEETERKARTMLKAFS